MILDANFPDSVQARNLPFRAEDRRGGAVSIAPRSSPSFAEIADRVEGKKFAVDAAGKATKAAPAKSFSLWENGEFGFSDLLDIINPLHHVPIVATIYRNMSGDRLGIASRVIGGALWGRIGGFIAGVVNAAVEWFTGRDIGDHIYASLFGGSDASTPSTAVAGDTGSCQKAKVTATLGDAKDAKVYPTIAPQRGRGSGLRSDVSADRIKFLSDTPAGKRAMDLMLSSQFLNSHYYRLDEAGRTAERQPRLRLTV